MATVQNLYTGDGSTVLFSFTFPYLAETDIKVSLDGVDTTAYTLANATTVQFNSAPTNGTAIRIYRQTADQTVDATFFPGSAIRASDLNSNFEQVLYLSQEANSTASNSDDTAADALATAESAVSTANAAVSTANAASSAASSAVSTANAASSAAASAVTTANTASSNATTAVNTANSAVSTANSAVSTANSAVSTANSAVSTANAATSTANDAAADAAQALVLVSSVVIYDPVSDVASIPGSPADGDRIEVLDSTGIESFSPLTGVPAGFVGAPDLYVRITYNAGGSTWEWVSYFPVDPDNRYPIQGKLGSAASPAYYFDSDTGLYSPGADQVAISTAGTGRVFVDASGNVGIGTSTVNSDLHIYDGAGDAEIRITSNSSNQAILRFGNTVDQTLGSIRFDSPSDSLQFYGLNDTERMRLTSDGKLGLGTSSPSERLHVSGGNARFEGNYVSFNNNGYIRTDATNELRLQMGSSGTTFYNSGNSVEYARIDSSGRLLVGTSTAVGTSNAVVIKGTSGVSNASIYLGNTANASTLIDGNTLGFIEYGSADGGVGAQILAVADGTWSSTSDCPTRLVFSTTADGASSPTERVRISATGAIGLSGANYGSSGQVLTSQGSGSAPTWSTVEGVPAGTVIYTAQSSAPTGYLKANGAAISRTTYASLFAAIGTTFGAGDGSTTFNLPDLRGEFVRGWDDGRGVDSGRSFGSSQGQATARPTTAFTTNTTGSHTHTGLYAGNWRGTDDSGLSTAYGGAWNPSFAGDHSHSITGGGDSETRPRNVALLACIKY